MTVNDFIPKPYAHLPEDGMVSWSSPSNIALVKYWGKKDGQIPANPSIRLYPGCLQDNDDTFI